METERTNSVLYEHSELRQEDQAQDAQLSTGGVMSNFSSIKAIKHENKSPGQIKNRLSQDSGEEINLNQFEPGLRDGSQTHQISII